MTGLGNQQIILGLTWLKEMNPIIDWKKGTLEWRNWKHSTLKRQPDDSKQLNTMHLLRMSKTIQEEEHPDYIQNPLNETKLSTIISTITGNCQRTPQSDSHYSRYSCHLQQSLVHPSTQTTAPLPAARDLTVVWPTCLAYVSNLHVQLSDHIINLIIYLR